MQFLCLHGALGNRDTIRIQLEPLQKELASGQVAEFHYTNAPFEANPPPGFREYFGLGPYFRWVDDEGAAEDSMLARIRELPVRRTPEDVMRHLMNKEIKWKNRNSVIQFLDDLLDKHPEIEGIVGYSEGSAMAATYIIDEQRRLKETGRTRRIKCAIFFTGWPPISNGNGPILSDESDVVVDVPTLHVVGANDPYCQGALALYNVCDPDVAMMFDTGKGHTVPRDAVVISELANEVKELIENTNSM
ncbi:uncharacterized protein TRUGW13939_00299 [Talaromyces rugulosus]|uniref:Serine hydrolase domain-containing protein n=1 Tax=Talaromyces rugulosus TaxID=121627 RepID=A0A7H8QJ52_TALRU|nr:uncharacterized protein TRUGW13939_00299 [Talaromyces rugulosus]QKX53223.1 hypothetical protein TRUGW13939_00299 [Talaromyces rugulosus]